MDKFRTRETDQSDMWRDTDMPFELTPGSNLLFPNFLTDNDSYLPPHSNRDTEQSAIDDFAKFEDMNFSKFNFAKEETALPPLLNQSINISGVTKESLIERIRVMEKRVAEKSAELLRELADRDNMKS
jgi:hypothetical protein